MSDSQPGMKLTALGVEDVARLLTRAGNKPVTMDMLNADIAAGAPVNADGTINIIQYGAWLVRAVADAD